ncbi:hypothetical protein MKW94_013761 [Papaver nudicaule]|uniref:TF-B3 domain-containing protein n=1 Tax=Papaver nudicaule TaxID=74823 RepID=A0AA41S1B2_PAPNU|nr:hypothetical protein [Papaver nudicaule]MCL7036678.1 hypothetical protein [Papaver nudicaule]
MVHHEVQWSPFLVYMKEEEDFKQKLKFPVNFFDGLTVSVNVLLRRNSCPYGRCWIVKMVTTEEGDLTFQDGWDTFVEDYPLELGDAFVVQYDGNSNFLFTLFGKDGCEKKYDTSRIRNASDTESEDES